MGEVGYTWRTGSGVRVGGRVGGIGVGGKRVGGTGLGTVGVGGLTMISVRVGAGVVVGRGVRVAVTSTNSVFPVRGRYAPTGTILDPNTCSEVVLRSK